MSTPPEIYRGVKPDIGAIAAPLVERSEHLLGERGFFLPHAAVLTAEGKVALLGAICSTPGGFADSTHILPMIHGGLRSMALERALTAVAVAECVSVNGPDGLPTQAIKILVEHSLGVALTIHLPYEEMAPRQFEFRPSFCAFVDPEINPW